MGVTEQNRNTIPFIGFLLLAGVLHIIEDFSHNVPSPDYSFVTMLFCLVFMIYSGLILFWIRSVHTRLLPSQARSCLIAAALLMLLYLSLRAFKYRIAGGNAGIRVCWYAFYIPMTMIPALFLAVCIRIARGERYTKWDERLTLVPAGILSAVILTNDLHHLVFIPVPGIEDFLGRMGTYTYGLPFYMAYAWIILAMAAGIVLLVKACGSRKNRKMTLSVAAVILLWFILIRLHSLKKMIEFIPPYEAPEIHIFCMLAVFEICIRSRLIPHNENYTGFFAKLPLPLMITDREYHPVYQSAAGIDADTEQLVSSLAAPVYPQPDRKLSGRQIHGGYAFWMEDESGVRKANEKLLEANDLLESENTLIEYENRQKEEKAYLQSRHQIYYEIAEEMYPYQKRIEVLLNETETGKGSSRDKIAMVSVLNAYVKRKTNLCLMASERETLPLGELRLAVSESGRYLFYVGIRTSVDESGFCGMQEDGRKETFLPSGSIIALYDTFEWLAEQMIGHTSLLMVSFSDESLKLAADTDFPLELKGTALPVQSEKREDILYLTIRTQKGGDCHDHP